jgi:hypothetical protein
VLCLLHDGGQWHAGIRRANGRWEIRQERTSGFEIPPDSILEWAVAQGVLNVRLAVPCELHQFEMDGEDLLVLNPSEIYSMLCYELAEKSGMDVDNIAPAAVRASELEIPSDPGQMLGGALDRSLVAGFHDIFNRYGMKFEGVSSLQGLLLARHVDDRRDPREALMFFGERESFICGIPRDDPTSLYRTIPVGHPGRSRSEEYERRIERRIKGFSGGTLNIVAPEMVLEECRSYVVSILGGDIRATPLKETVPDIMQLLAGARRYMLEGPVALTGLPPKARDDKFTGGVICFWSIFLTTLVLGGLFGFKSRQKHSLTKLREDIRNLEQRQRAAEAAFKSAEREIDGLKKLHAFLGNEPQKVDRRFTEILVALSQTLPHYSRITDIYQSKDRTVVTGITLWPQELSEFSVELQRKLGEFGVTVVPKTTAPVPGSESTLFVMEIL